MDRIELLKGTLDMLILRTLQWGAQHGHGIGVAIRASSDDALQVEHGSLYPALHRLRKQGLIDAEWKLTENNQRARYYRLTAKGRKMLVSEEARWNRMVEPIARVMGPGEKKMRLGHKRFRRAREDSELDEELRFHLQQEAQLRIDRGQCPEDANRSARRDFGNVTRTKEVTRE